MMFSKKTPAVLATFLLGIALSGSALACATDGWNTESGMVGVGQPFDATPPDLNGVARVEELCAMVATGTGYVQTNSPAHSEVTNRVYIKADITGGAGTAKVLVLYSAEDGTGEVASIAHDGTNWVFTTGGGSESVAATSGWDWIEYHWNGTTFEYWVNADATMDPPTGSFDGGGAATIESVRLGLPEGLGGLSGMFNFDSFQMNNMTAIGPLLIGDANGDMDVGPLDYFTVRDEILATAVAPGTPDCNLDGEVGPLDYFCIRDIILQ